jgi:hypothetical protein
MIKSTDGTFSTSTEFTGRAFAADYASPSPGILTTAVSAMETAYNNAAGRPSTVTFEESEIGGKTLSAGVYTFNVDINISKGLIITGSADDIFIFKTSGSIVQAANTRVTLAGGAKAENIFWQVAGTVSVGAGAHLEGVLLVKTAVTFTTGSSLNGRILTQTACTLGMATITEPSN